MTTMLIDEHAPPRSGLLSQDGRTYPLESVQVDARTEGGIALTTLRQRFRNPYAEALEVLYTLPLPADGAVLGYTITMGERRIVGEIQTREAAAEAYREAIYEGRTAGLLEQDRSDTFQQQLGNLPSRVSVEVETQILHPLAFRPGESRSEWEYRFPTTVGVRYMGEEGRVPDAERLSPARPEEGTPARLSGSVLIAGPVGEGSMRSPTHGVEHRPEAEGIRIRLTEEARLDRDLVLRWPALTPEVGVHLVGGGGLEGDEGRYALLTVLPPEQPRTTHPRDVTILLDSSGSMGGKPLALAKQVVEGILGSLHPRDRFRLMSFGMKATSLTSGVVQAGAEEVARARAELGRLSGAGGTEMRSAVREALRSLRRGVQHQVILVTDGYIGFEGEVVREAMRALPATVRFHAVGVGAAPNRTLTGSLARAGRGLELFAYDDASAREAAELLAAATARPVITELSVEGSAVRARAPARPGDVMAGCPTTLTLELAPEGGLLEVQGALAGEEEGWSWRVEVPAEGREWTPGSASLRLTPIPLGALHGREVVADLELEEAAGAPRGQVSREIEARALRHRIVSRRTSLVAISEVPTVDPREPRRRERLAVELPAGVSAEGVGLTRERGAVAELYRTSLSAEVLKFAEGDGPRGLKSRQAMFAHDMAPELSEGDGSAEAPDTEITDVEVLRLEGDLLVLEIEVPSNGFLAPGDEVRARYANGRSFRAYLDAEVSTPGGPHPAGVRIRAALRREGGRPWTPGSELEIAFTRNDVNGATWDERWHLSLTLPEPTRPRSHGEAR